MNVLDKVGGLMPSWAWLALSMGLWVLALNYEGV